MDWFKWFKKRKTEALTPEPEPEKLKDPIDKNYVCIGIDPINTVNDLRVGEWDMDKVQKSLWSGMLRYAKKSEIEKAKEIGRL